MSYKYSPQNTQYQRVSFSMFIFYLLTFKYINLPSILLRMCGLFNYSLGAV